jgi:hypothetical protein
MLNIRQGLRNIKEDYVDGHHWIMKAAVAVLVVYFLIASVLGFYWNSEPDVSPLPSAHTVTGAATTGALLHLANTLMDKPGGYLLMMCLCLVCGWTIFLTGNSVC